jgi:hypothetical protein
MNGVATLVVGILATWATTDTTGLLVGDTAVRSMSLAAGAFLFIGVALYYAVRGKAEGPEAPVEA